MDGLQIGSLIFGVVMIAMMLPRAIYAMKHGRKGSTQEWLNVMCIFGAVGFFVWLLMQMV